MFSWRIIIDIYSHKSVFHLFYHYLSIKIKGVSLYLPLRSIITIELTYITISAGRAWFRVCMSVCTCQSDLYYAIYFHINRPFNSFIITTSIKCNRITESLPLRRIIIVKVTYNSIRASRPRCRLIAPSVYVNWHIVFHIFLHKPLFHLFNHYLSIKTKGVSIYLPLRSIIAIEMTYTTISASRPRCRPACRSVHV